MPAGALTGAQSWLTAKDEAHGNTALFVPFLIAFGVLGVVMAVLIIGNVIAGAVGTAHPPDRHPQGARVHPGPGRAGLHGPGADPRRRSAPRSASSPATS